MVAVSRAETKNAVEAAGKKVLQGTGKTAQLLGRILLFCCDLCSGVSAGAAGLFKALAVESRLVSALQPELPTSDMVPQTQWDSACR